MGKKAKSLWSTFSKLWNTFWGLIGGLVSAVVIGYFTNPGKMLLGKYLPRSLSPPAIVEGYVKSKGRATRRVEIVLDGKETETPDSRGRYTFRNVECGDHRLSFLSAGGQCSFGTSFSIQWGQDKISLDEIDLDNLAPTDPEEATALIAACRAGDFAAMKSILERHVSPDCMDARTGQTPLAICAIQGSLQAMKILLKRGAYVDRTDKLERTALILATRANQFEAVQTLLDCGADPNMPDQLGMTALMYAAEKKDALLAKAILDGGGRKGINIRDKNGETALMKAVHEHRTEMVALLLNYGASRAARDAYGHTALAKAKTGYDRYTVQSGTHISKPTREPPVSFRCRCRCFGGTSPVRPERDEIIANQYKEIIGLLEEN